MRSEKSVAACVERIARALDASALKWNGHPPVVRRKVRGLLGYAGRRKVTAAFISQLGSQLRAANLFTNPPLDGRPIFQDRWLEFSTAPFEAPVVFFPDEEALREFMRRAVGVVRPFDDLREIGREYALPSGKRIDLLCEEVVQSGKGDLVAVELKRGDPSYDVVTQLDAYLDELETLPYAEGRQVRGLIVSGPDRDGPSAAGAQPRHRVDWFYYSVDLKERPRDVPHLDNVTTTTSAPGRGAPTRRRACTARDYPAASRGRA